MSKTSANTGESTAYDNGGQYSRTSILRYEQVVGAGYVSTGGPETTEYLCKKLGSAARQGMRVLDVGSGIGGAAFHLARTYGAHVLGVDLAPEMLNIAHERAVEFKGPGSCEFKLGDVLTEPFAHKFDLIWSRDALMHLPDKPHLFKRLFDLTAPGGALVITDYARGETGSYNNPAFDAYIKATGYHVVSPREYGKFLEGAGYVSVDVEDATSRFVDILRRESERLKLNRSHFLTLFSESDLDYLVERWSMKDGFCEAGAMKWGIYVAHKPK